MIDMISSASLADAFAAQAACHPERQALRAEGGGIWNYAQLDAQAAALAADLADLNLAPESRIALVGGRTAETVVAILGILKSGAAYCVIDPATPSARRNLILADLKPAALVATEPRHAIPTMGECAVVCLPTAAPADRSSGAACLSGAPSGRSPSALAYVMYTSGSTGRPKGVMVEHGSVLNMLCSYESLAPADDGFAGTLLAPATFDVSVWEIFSVLCYGGTLHVPLAHRLTDGDELWRFLRAAAIESAYLPPGLLPSVVDAAEACGGGALRRALIGVEPIPQGLMGRFRIACPGLRVVNGYGPTETTITATLHLMGEVTDPGRRIPVGRAVRGSRVEVVDRWLLPVLPGEIGEIVVAGACLARGYLNQSAGGFIDWSSGRAYRTGDYGRFLPDGTLEISGRRDGQVKVNGFRVETGEVETVLNAVPGVRRAVVFAAGEPGPKRLFAAVEAESRLKSSDIRGYLTTRLPAHAVPSRIIVTRTFPFTGNGKVDITALLTLARERPAEVSRYVPPGSAWQKELAEVWAQVLGIAEIGLDDDFFALGGTSLDAVSIARQLRGAGHAMSATVIMDTRTVRGLAEHRAAEAQSARAEPVVSGSYPVSRSHEGLWAWRELNPDAAATTVVHAIRLDGEADPARMHRAMCAVAQRHEALRTTFELTFSPRLQQQVSGEYQCELPVMRISSHGEVDRCMEELLQQRMDVRVHPWTARLLQGSGFGALVFAADHLIFDGESAAVLQFDLARAYDDPRAISNSVAGPASAACMPPLSSQRVARLHDYWSQALDGFRDYQALAESDEMTARDRRLQRTERVIDSVVWEATCALARKAGTTPFVVVLAAFKAFLRGPASDADNVVSVAVSRRHAIGCPDAIGYFVNLVPIRDQVSRNATRSLRFDRYLVDVAERVRKGIAHSDLPFEEIITQASHPRTAQVAGPARVVLAQKVQMGTSITETGLCLGPWPHQPSNTIYDLTVFMTEATASSPASLEWLRDEAKTPNGSVESLAEAFSGFLRAAVAEPERAIAALPVFAPEAAHRTVRVGTGDVEAMLSSHPAVKQAAVYREDVDGIRALVATVEAAAVAGATLRAWLADRVPEHLVPDQVRVVDRLPTTASGEIDHAALRGAQPPTDRQENEVKRGAIQRSIAEICGELLGSTDIGLDDDFFEFGANSMIVLELAVRLGQHFNRPVPAHILYSAPTVRSLASHIDSSSAAEDSKRALRVRERASRVRTSLPGDRNTGSRAATGSA